MLYSIGFMAIDQRTLKKINPADRDVLTEVLTRLYADLNAKSEGEAKAATNALLNVGVEEIALREGEFRRIRGEMDATNRMMAEKGMFSLELLEEMEQHVEDYRREHVGKPEQNALVEPSGGAN